MELFTSPSAVTHITTLAQLSKAKAEGGLKEVDTGIVFLCPIVSSSSYYAGTPAGWLESPLPGETSPVGRENTARREQVSASRLACRFE